MGRCPLTARDLGRDPDVDDRALPHGGGQVVAGDADRHLDQVGGRPSGRARSGAAARRRRPAGSGWPRSGSVVVDGEVAVGGRASRGSAPGDARGRRQTGWPRRAGRAATAQTATVSSAAASSRAPSTTEAATSSEPEQQPRVAPARRSAAAAHRDGAVSVRAGAVSRHRRHGPLAGVRPQARRVKRSQPSASGGRVDGHGRDAEVPPAGRRRRDPEHLRRPGLRAGAPPRAQGDQDRRSRSVARRGQRARGLHPAGLRRRREVRARPPLRRGPHPRD